jgi:hypothetical protein
MYTKFILYKNKTIELLIFQGVNTDKIYNHQFHRNFVWWQWLAILALLCLYRELLASLYLEELNAPPVKSCRRLMLVRSVVSRLRSTEISLYITSMLIKQA